MRTISGVVLAVLLTACGPLPAPTATDTKGRITIENRYAESIFSLSYVLVTAGGSVENSPATPFDNVRIAGSSSESKDISIPEGRNVRFDLTATSLGQTRGFNSLTPKTSPLGSKSNLVIAYDYDFATAGFRVTYEWTY